MQQQIGFQEPVFSITIDTTEIYILKYKRKAQEYIMIEKLTIFHLRTSTSQVHTICDRCGSLVIKNSLALDTLSR